MIQDIAPHVFDNAYSNKLPDENSVLLCFKGNKVLISLKGTEIQYPKPGDLKMNSSVKYIYLFNIDGNDYFLAQADQDIEAAGYSFENITIFRQAMPRYRAFAAITAYHLHCWYRDNTYCGRCGNGLEHDTKERMLFCSYCKKALYPQISPVVIVAVTDGDRLLMTKYAGRDYKKYALVAGFIEFGETAEEAVKREVKEEVGLNVKNITYYKSQPWGFSESLLLGYLAEVDGGRDITMDEGELSEAAWIKRDKIEIVDDGVSLTNEMIRMFKNGSDN